MVKYAGPWRVHVRRASTYRWEWRVTHVSHPEAIGTEKARGFAFSYKGALRAAKRCIQRNSESAEWRDVLIREVLSA